MGTDDDDDVNILFVVDKAKSFVSNYKFPLSPSQNQLSGKQFYHCNASVIWQKTPSRRSEPNDNLNIFWYAIEIYNVIQSCLLADNIRTDIHIRIHWHLTFVCVHMNTTFSTALGISRTLADFIGVFEKNLMKYLY